ncbi:putative phage abortive infection protein [Flavobacterium tructae]|uniref:Phage abortive infection protein n=1 Tax=Flavobacterium tructae TaxID=1114873 RepID=A0A1S1J593_9FLAO|nr:putative phage abortive infection protein [Flavobacterium tructae]OHT45827.1 hypothetical protein BHE19_08335 [Flavobacterium tructae]OXB17088.1 hypothetical protein B0A71_17625 [Flavobacterium tructae]
MKEENDNLKFIILLLSISLLWVWSWIFIDKFVAIEQRANFGDKFGFINSLFSGLALAVIIYSIILQQKELNLQRKELSDTRQEFKDQNFQTTFFNLIKTQQQIVNEISTTIVDLKSYNQYSYYEANGRTFFMRSRIEFKRIEKALNSSFVNFSEWTEYDEQVGGPQNEYEEQGLFDSRKLSYTLKYYDINKKDWEDAQRLKELELAKFIYGKFFNKFLHVYGHYFRHIYHILLFLDKTEHEKMAQFESLDEKQKIKQEFYQYANFVQAQMTTPELFLTFYNSLSFFKLQKLIIKYNLLENLPKEDLIHEKHNIVEGISLKSRVDILN